MLQRFSRVLTILCSSSKVLLAGYILRCHDFIVIAVSLGVVIL